MEHCGPDVDAAPSLQRREEGDGVFGKPVCACVWRTQGNSEEAEGCSPVPERFVSAKRFPCPSQMAGHAPPLAGEKEE